MTRIGSFGFGRSRLVHTEQTKKKTKRCAAKADESQRKTRSLCQAPARCRWLLSQRFDLFCFVQCEPAFRTGVGTVHKIVRFNSLIGGARIDPHSWHYSVNTFTASASRFRFLIQTIRRTRRFFLLRRKRFKKKGSKNG